MKMKTGKLFFDISNDAVKVIDYDLSQEYYSLIKKAQENNFRQVIITSDIMIGLAEYLLTSQNSTITSISFFVDDEELQQEIDRTIKSLQNNLAYWGALKTKLDFLSKYDSIDIKEMDFNNREQRYLAKIFVNGIICISESNYSNLASKIATFVERSLQ